MVQVPIKIALRGDLRAESANANKEARSARKRRNNLESRITMNKPKIAGITRNYIENENIEESGQFLACLLYPTLFIIQSLIVFTIDTFFEKLAQIIKAGIIKLKQIIPQNRCKYFKICPYYDRYSVACNSWYERFYSDGRAYCGKYRKFDK